MSSPASNDAVRIAPGAAARALRGMVLCVALAWLVACGSTPGRPAAVVPVERSAAPAPAAPATTAPAATPASVGASAGAVPPASAAAGAAAPPPRPEVPPAARADFDRAVNFMRVGNMTEAELGFKQIALQYPQFAAPLVNVAILKRKQGELPEAERLLKSAVEHESGNAIAWTELGATQSLRGEFKDAASSYQRAIGAEPRYAPAWRNLGVVQDLYLGDPRGALASLEQYKQLSGEDKPVSGWIAELRQRLGVKPPAAPVPAPAAAAPGAPATPGGAPAPVSTATPAPVAAPAASTPAKGGN